jgi:hypothetical protein
MRSTKICASKLSATKEKIMTGRHAAAGCVWRTDTSQQDLFSNDMQNTRTKRNCVACVLPEAQGQLSYGGWPQVILLAYFGTKCLLHQERDILSPQHSVQGMKTLEKPEHPKTHGVQQSRQFRSIGRTQTRALSLAQQVPVFENKCKGIAGVEICFVVSCKCNRPDQRCRHLSMSFWSR